MSIMHYLGRLIAIAISYSLLVVFAERVLTFLTSLYISRLQRKTRQFHSIATPTAPIERISSLHGFDYRVAEPIKYRPFETKRHVTMGRYKMRVRFFATTDTSNRCQEVGQGRLDQDRQKIHGSNRSEKTTIDGLPTHLYGQQHCW
jgi:hypothetical protein